MRFFLTLSLFVLAQHSFASNESQTGDSWCTCVISIDANHFYSAYEPGPTCKPASDAAVKMCSIDFETKTCEQNIDTCVLDDGEYPIFSN